MRKGPHPALFFLLVLPYSISYGYVGVALVSLAASRGVTPEAIGAVVSAVFVVHGLKFLWAPVVDTTFTKKGWYLFALALIALGTLATTAIPLRPDTLDTLKAVILPSQLGLSLLGMACEAFLGHCVPEEEKGLASGLYQCGNMVGYGVGGGAALWLAQRVPQGWMVGAAMAAVMSLSALALLALPEPPRPEARLLPALRALLLDLWRVLSSREGMTGLVIALCPISAGAASNYFAALAPGWGASEDTVAAVNGTLGGLVSAGGALLGGWLADRMSRRLAYALSGAATAVVAALMLAAPHTQSFYAALTLAYVLCNGLAYATLAAFVFETVGHGAVASKYTVFVSLANLAIGYCTRLEGKVHTAYGERGLLLTDVGLTATGIVILLAMVAFTRRPAPVAATSAGGR